MSQSVSHKDVPWVDGSGSLDGENDGEEDGVPGAQNGEEARESLIPRPLHPPPVIVTPPPPSHPTLKRRNSISLPANLDNIRFASDTVSSRGDVMSEDDIYSEAPNSDEEEEETDEETQVKTPLRNSRRKSVMPHRLQVPDREFLTIEQSPHTSMTSINSISSLLREKIMFSLPAAMKKKPTKFKIKAFVILVFSAVVVLVSFAHLYYQQLVVQRFYFDWLRFNNKERKITFYNEDGEQVLRGVIGMSTERNKVYKCLLKHEKPDYECMEWMSLARLYLTHRIFPLMDCYYIMWESLNREAELTDCYEISPDFGHWYGGGITRRVPWPLENGYLETEPFITSNMLHQWGNVLKRSFYNSKGVAITVHPETPFYISMHSVKDRMLCLHAKFDDFAFMQNSFMYPKLNYTVCTARNLKTLHHSLSEKKLWGGMKDNDIVTVKKLLSEPVWQIAPFGNIDFTEDDIYNYTEEIDSFRFLRHGHILLNEFWQSNVGDFKIDSSRFENMENISDTLYRRGFRTILTIQPFISLDSFNFHKTVQRKYLVRERDAEIYIPALTKYKNDPSIGVLDITKNETVFWLHNTLRETIDQYKIDGFFIDYGSAYDMPRHYKLDKNLTSPDEYLTLFTQTIQQSFMVLGVSGAVAFPKPPTFVLLPPFASSWESLREIIPTVLTYGVIGYPLIIPGAVGGDYYAQDENIQTNNDTYNSTDKNVYNVIPFIPEKELYVRWLQLSMFLPVVRYNQPPSRYGDEILKMVEDMTTLRDTLITPLLMKFLGEALDSGIPIIRPLWMLDPEDTICQTISDQFTIGDELIVAPILKLGDVEREIYLPTGMWIDGIVGTLRKGKRWLHDYRVGPDNIAYFTRVPNNNQTKE